MTAPPRAKFGAPIVVQLPKPRSAAQLLHDPYAIRIRAEIVERLSEFIHTRKTGPSVIPIRLSAIANEERAS